MPSANEAMQRMRLPVTTRKTEYGDGLFSEFLEVQCPMHNATMPLVHCLKCDRCRAVDTSSGETFLQCDITVRKALAWTGQLDGDLLERFLGTSVCMVMSGNVTCLDGDLTLEEAEKILEQDGALAAPVVEDEGVLLGMVTREDLVMRVQWPRPGDPMDDEPTLTDHLLVEDVMGPKTVSVLESESLKAAVDTMVRHAVRFLPVVSRKDTVVGMLSDADVLRWMAEHVPDHDCRNEPSASS
jgi:CBS domain-containing protein